MVCVTITYVNKYHDAWMEEAARREEGRRNEDSDSPSSAGSNKKKRRFTENKSKGPGKVKGWAKSGIKLYNKINKVPLDNKGVMNHWWSLTKN